MSVIENKYWQGEPLKAVIKFDENTEYTVFTNTEQTSDSNWIYKASFSLSEGNNKVNPLGISTSNRVTLQIYDKDDSLSPANTKSTLYGKVVNGVEIDLYISYDLGETYESYGIFYATSWDGMFSEGWHGMINLSAEDKLNTIGNYDLPELPAYANVQAGDLIANVFKGIGISTSEYTIDPAINKELYYGVAQGGKVRDFINNICQLLFARVIIDREGIIRFVPALSFYNNCNEITLEGEDTGSFQNKNNNNINYNKLSVKYLLAGDTSRATIFSDNNHNLIVGENKINDITFRNKVLSIEQVECIIDSKENNANIESMHYQGYQDGIEITIKLSGEATTNCLIQGEGIVVSTTSKNVTVTVDNTSVIGGSTFEFDTKQMMSESQATEIANNLKEYMSKISRNVIMQGTALTPKLYVGDKVTIENTDTMYDGTYKIVALNIEFGENYSLSSTFIRLE